MAIIQSYPINYNIKDSDLLLGITNIATSGNPIYQTKSFRLSDIIGGGSASAPSYGQLYLPTGGYTVPIAAINVWQPLGLVATLVSPSPGFSLGIVDKCAFKNISGSAKTVNVFCEIYSSLPGQAFIIDGIAIALNGNVLQNSATPEVLTSQSISCIVEMQDSDEVSVYIKSTTLGDADIRVFKLNIFEI